MSTTMNPIEVKTENNDDDDDNVGLSATTLMSSASQLHLEEDSKDYQGLSEIDMRMKSGGGKRSHMEVAKRNDDVGVSGGIRIHVCFEFEF